VPSAFSQVQSIPAKSAREIERTAWPQVGNSAGE
jgi:hypothetical protein